jgi:hypothetical protein
MGRLSRFSIPGKVERSHAPALEPTQPPIQFGGGGLSGLDIMMTLHLHQLLSSRVVDIYTSILPCVFMAW